MSASCFGCKDSNADHSPECLYEAAITQGWEYPAISDFEEAVNDFFICIDVVGARGAALQKIAEMRKLKTTWLGEEENAMRFKLDDLLETAGRSIYG